jgi:hypothetical protein
VAVYDGGDVEGCGGSCGEWIGGGLSGGWLW